MKNVLLLNASYHPLNVIPVKRAFKLISLGKVEIVIESDVTWSSVHFTFKVPSVIRLLRYISVGRNYNKAKLTRRHIFTRDKYTCQYCGNTKDPQELTIDHVIPRAQGGQTTWENVTAACISCNREKRDRTPKQAGMKLISTPKEPFMVSLTLRIGKENVPEDWASYLYWNIPLKN